MRLLEHIVKFLHERGSLVQQDALEFLAQLPDPMARLKDGLAGGRELPFILTLDQARRLMGAPEPAPRPAATPVVIPMAPPAPRRVDPPPPAPTLVAGPMLLPPLRSAPSFKEEVRAVAADFEVLSDVTGHSTCEGTVDDFAKLFRDRYNRMRRMFRGHREVSSAVPIGNVRAGKDVRIIAIVNDVKETKNGHRILQLEDETGQITALASKTDARVLELAASVLEDEIVGIAGELLAKRGEKDELLIVKELVRPEVPLDHKPHRGSRGSVVFVSDVHVGAKTFLGDAWDRLIESLARRELDATQGSPVKYLVINGDLVDGVGIYPGQERELAIPDVFDQYKEAALTLAKLPADLHVLVLPGNHDAVRPAEPQPSLPASIRELFPRNVTFLGNPCLVSFTGVEVLCYHGVSLFDFFEHLPHCSIERPIPTMEEMLRRRHLCPVYGGRTPLAPEHRDHLVIERIPDVFVTGHVHTAQTGEYRGTKLLNASTWQQQTSYQRMMGFVPDPCKAFAVDLETLAVTTYTYDAKEATGAVRVANPVLQKKQPMEAMAR